MTVLRDALDWRRAGGAALEVFPTVRMFLHGFVLSWVVLDKAVRDTWAPGCRLAVMLQVLPAALVLLYAPFEHGARALWPGLRAVLGWLLRAPLHVLAWGFFFAAGLVSEILTLLGLALTRPRAAGAAWTADMAMLHVYRVLAADAVRSAWQTLAADWPQWHVVADAVLEHEARLTASPTADPPLALPAGPLAHNSVLVLQPINLDYFNRCSAWPLN